MANPDPAGKSIHQSIPPRRLPPIQRQFVRKTSNPRTFGALKFMARYLRVGPKQKTRRHAFSNQNTAGPSQKRRHVFPTKTRPDQAKRDATFFRPKHRQAKPNEGHSRDSSNVRFSGPTGGKSAQHRGSQTGGKSAQRQNQPNPGLIGQDLKKSLTGEGWQTWVTYTRLPGYPGV